MTVQLFDQFALHHSDVFCHEDELHHEKGIFDAQPGVVAYHGEPLADDSDTQMKRMVMWMNLMDCYQKLVRLDLRSKSKFRNGEYQVY